ncbi:Fusarinine C esterase sidJ [Penicillium macrosclerotiorum]|uniref:Fusarinine C esterase sidJ n=1 Tax=Penicillium macrosclerotiorum TaxID=303699 RepID=UPI002546AD45|nr:Fusarinine C esterase sidJ [Penicillium macrosclerotiorum]KAJ5683287.1 Fusarinine C esterase sidJ [Penicillium macrosclerotiorum]
MSPSTNRKSSPSGILHQYASRLVAFEYTSPAQASKPNSLIFVGGLTDGFNTVPYVSTLATALQDSDWSLFSILLTSSYNGFGTSSLDQDVEEIGQCVQFIRDLKSDHLSGKIVVMGHSTGSQDVLHYLYAPNPVPKTEIDLGLQYLTRPAIDGAIMQAPVSDREATLLKLKTANEPNEVRGAYDQLVDAAKRQPWTPDGHDSLLPLDMTARLGLPGGAPISARRFLSLVSPDSPAIPSQDDLFSSDLNEMRLQETFGVIGTRGLLNSKLCALYSGSDEYCPPWVDKQHLMQRWKQATEAGGTPWDENSGVISGASHNAKDVGQKDLVDRVLRYLKSV